MGARLTALQTVNVLRQVVATAQFSTIEELINLLKAAGQQLQDAQPKGKGPDSLCKNDYTEICE